MFRIVARFVLERAMWLVFVLGQCAIVLFLAMSVATSTLPGDLDGVVLSVTVFQSSDVVSVHLVFRISQGTIQRSLRLTSIYGFRESMSESHSCEH